MAERRKRHRLAVTSQGTIDIGDGIVIPTKIAASDRTDDDRVTVTLTALYDPAMGRYRPKAVEVFVYEDGEVTGEALRAVRVAQLLRSAVIEVLAGSAGVLVRVGERRCRVPADSAAARMLAGGTLRVPSSTDETLRLVALLYRLAVLIGDPPTEAVALSLSVPRSTAGRWVTRARDRGLLTVVDPRGRMEA